MFFSGRNIKKKSHVDLLDPERLIGGGDTEILFIFLW